MSADIVALKEPEDEGQRSFFDPTLYQTNLFSLSGANKHHTDDELRPGQAVSGRFWGAVVGVKLEGFASDKTSPTRIYLVTADRVELD